MKSYETVFVLTPDLRPAEAKEISDRLISLLVSSSAEILNQEDWGIRQLAYPIQGKGTGFYNLVEFNAEPSVVGMFETELRRSESVIRFLTVALDKDALEYNRRRKNGEFSQKKAKNISKSKESSAV